MEIKESRQASPEAELFFQTEQLRATDSLRNWRVCVVALGAAGFVGLEGERVYQGVSFSGFVSASAVSDRNCLFWQLFLSMGTGQAFAQLNYF